MSEEIIEKSPNKKFSKEWYESWFDTSYYHILYRDRNEEEAQIFMDNLVHYLNIPENGKILDLACGKGRHAIYLNQLGYNVIGADLSLNSIKEAKQFENEKLHFEVHDMRIPFQPEFDAVFNLFTSFGYFEEDVDNQKALLAMKNSLNEYGFGVIDFLNANYVKNNLVEKEVKVIDGISFEIKREIIENNIIKDIFFNHSNQNFHFTEKVKLYTLEDFEKMMTENDIYLLDVFGDYKLKRYYQETSERLILIFK